MVDGCLPVPSIMGGAVETLLTMLIEQNEKNPQYEFYFIMSKTKTEKKVNFSFTHTHLYQVNTSSFERKLFKYINYANKMCNYKWPFYSPYNIKVFKLLNEIKPDFIIYEGGLDASIKKLKKQKNIIISAHIHGQIKHKKCYDLNLSNIIAVSEFIKKDWLKDCPNANVQVLPNAVNSKYFQINNITENQKKKLREKLGINCNDFVVLYAGRIIPIKGVLELAQAVVELNDLNIKLLMIGSTFFDKKMKQTSYQKQIRKLMSENPNLIATGHIPYEELVHYYAISDVQVIPSLCEEASGMVAIEGNYCGLPQIITNSGGLSENCPSSTIIVNKRENLIEQLKKAITEVKNNNVINNKDVNSFTEKEYFNQFVKILGGFDEKN